MGGGGFTSEPHNPALDDFILSLAPAPRAAHPVPAHRQRRPQRPDRRVPVDVRRALLPGAPPLAVSPRAGAGRPAHADPRPGHRLRRRRLDAQPAGDLARARPRPAPARGVGGGRRARRAERRRDVLVRARHHALGGTPAAGAGLGFLPGSLSVHYDGDPIRRPAYLDAVERGRSPAATAPTTASACCSRARSSRGSSPRGRARAPTACSAAAARARDRARDGARARAARPVAGRALARGPRRHPRVPRRALRRLAAALSGPDATRRSASPAASARRRGRGARRGRCPATCRARAGRARSAGSATSP